MKIVVLDGNTLNPGDNPWTPLETFGELTVFERSNADEILPRASGADILLTNKTPLSAETIGQLDDLKFIGVLATGINVVDLAAARERGIPVSNVPVYGTDSVAEHVMACVLTLVHQIEAHDQAIRGGQWQQRGEFSFWLRPMFELVDKTISIIGFGRIGRRVGELAAAFRMNVLAHTPNRRTDRLNYSRFDWCSMQQAFREADFVSLHCPLTDDNAQFVNRQLLEQMKPTAFLVNTARGGLINEQDLAVALNSDQIAGACLDVVSAEPIEEDNPLLTAKNCLLTPHNAWCTVKARRRLMLTTADNIEAFISGHPINVVN